MSERMRKKELLEVIKNLKISINEFVIVSSSSLVLRDILEDAGDLDLAVTVRGLEQLKDNYQLKQKENGWFIVNDKIECVLDDMNNRKEKIEGFYVQDINDYLEYLELSTREKDKQRIPLVRKYINDRNK